MSDNPYPDGDGMKLNMGRNTMNYELHTAWDEGYAEGFAAGRAAATSDQRNGCRAPHCFSEYGTPCGTCPALAASADKGWSPGIDDPEPPALGDIDTGEGWYQT